MKELETQNIVVCAWRLDTKISAEKYVDALDKLIALAKKEVFDDKEFDIIRNTNKFKKLMERHFNTNNTDKLKEGENGTSK